MRNRRYTKRDANMGAWLIATYAVVVLALWIAAIVIAAHFIAKFW